MKFSQGCVDDDSFEYEDDFEDNDFCGIPREALPGGRGLRIQNPEDPVVPMNSLDPLGLDRCEIWWHSDAGLLTARVGFLVRMSVALMCSRPVEPKPMLFLARKILSELAPQVLISWSTLIRRAACHAGVVVALIPRARFAWISVLPTRTRIVS